MPITLTRQTNFTATEEALLGAEAFSSYSQEGSFFKPLCLTFDGNIGGTKTLGLLLNTGSASRDNLKVSSSTTDTTPTPYSVQFKSTENGTLGDSINFGTVNAATSVSFFIEITLNTNTSVTSFKGLKIKVEHDD